MKRHPNPPQSTTMGIDFDKILKEAYTKYMKELWIYEERERSLPRSVKQRAVWGCKRASDKQR
jgi:hypothetical protein